ncbi:hypothetical protein [Mycolicibacterium lacusdiani]|uniref:hypothetical protein n=1 Tax=Mycolicibacterium lacusdiani TaxID=2895283 RepID=UPI0024BF7D01|nr:hypothetical protein [Mycolicibacterium lacusdiani]
MVGAAAVRANGCGLDVRPFAVVSPLVEGWGSGDGVDRVALDGAGSDDSWFAELTARSACRLLGPTEVRELRLVSPAE